MNRKKKASSQDKTNKVKDKCQLKLKIQNREKNKILISNPL
jgi:hypothetical protein